MTIKSDSTKVHNYTPIYKHSPERNLNSRAKKIGTTDNYIKMLESFKATKKVNKDDNSTETIYTDSKGNYKGSIFSKGKFTSIQIDNQIYIDYDGDKKIDRFVQKNSDGNLIHNEDYNIKR